MNKENKIRDLLNSLEENLNESINDNIEPIEDFKVGIMKIFLRN